jgi:hypothetical protein
MEAERRRAACFGFAGRLRDEVRFLVTVGELPAAAESFFGADADATTSLSPTCELVSFTASPVGWFDESSAGKGAVSTTTCSEESGFTSGVESLILTECCVRVRLCYDVVFTSVHCCWIRSSETVKCTQVRERREEWRAKMWRRCGRREIEQKSPREETAVKKKKGKKSSLHLTAGVFLFPLVGLKHPRITTHFPRLLRAQCQAESTAELAPRLLEFANVLVHKSGVYVRRRRFALAPLLSLPSSERREGVTR